MKAKLFQHIGLSPFHEQRILRNTQPRGTASRQFGITRGRKD